MPNKAVAGAGGTTLSGALVAVFLWAFGLNPPQEIAIALVTIVSAASSFAAVYWTRAEAALHITTETKTDQAGETVSKSDLVAR